MGEARRLHRRLSGHWIVDIGLETGVFEAIADAGDADLAALLDSDPRYVQLWCRSPDAFELLEWDHAAGYRLTPEMRTLLLDTADRCFMCGRMQFFAAFYEDFRAARLSGHRRSVAPQRA